MQVPQKYELLATDLIDESGCPMFRIKALRDFGNIKVGDLGGYVSGEHNLSHEGNAWIADEAQASSRARVYGDALLADRARISDEAQLYETAQARGDVRIGGNTQIYGRAHISECVTVSDNAQIFDDARIRGTIRIRGDAWIFARAEMFGDGDVFGDALITDKSAFYEYPRTDSVVKIEPLLGGEQPNRPGAPRSKGFSKPANSFF